MHVLFVHKNFPAQFGHIARRLVDRHGFRCTFVSEKGPANVGGVEVIPYCTSGGATQQTHICSRTFENAAWHSWGVFQALKGRPDVRPDLVVGHSGFSSTVFLRELYDCPFINYFEFYYHVSGTDMDFRPDFPTTETHRLRSFLRNAMLLVDLEHAQAAYSPTHWQRDLFPERFRDKISVIFDGVDLDLWRPFPVPDRRVGNVVLPADKKIVTYVSRGFESMRGFDVFMKAAKKLYERRSDVLFVVVGEDRICYGGDAERIGGASFKSWVLSQDQYDLSRFLFLDRIPPDHLAQLFNLSDLHIYLTVPFVLSWSLMNALACGTTVLASDTAPVREMIEHERNGLLTDFFDADALADQATAVLDSPEAFRQLGAAGAAMIRDRYGLDDCLERMVALYQQTIEKHAGTRIPALPSARQPPQRPA